MVVLELDALLVLVDELKLKLLPSIFTLVAGALPNLKVTLVAELGIVNECEVDVDKVPCQVVAPLIVTDIQALLVADKLTFGLLDAFFSSQVELDVVELSFLKVAVLATFFFEELFEEDD